MHDIFALDPKLGYIPAIPEPFWYSSWRTLFKLRPACYHCPKMKIFKTRAEYETHMVKRILVTSAIAISSLAAQDTQQPKVPRFHLDHEGWANMIAVGTITGLDHYSTQRLLARGPRYYEGNSFIVASDGRSVDLKKAMLFDGVQIGLNLLYHGVFKRHVPAKYQWLIRIPMNGAQVYRLKVVVDNLTMK